MNSLLLANLTKNHEEARKPVSLHSGVAEDILLCKGRTIIFYQGGGGLPFLGLADNFFLKNNAF